MAGVSADELLTVLRRAVGETTDSPASGCSDAPSPMQDEGRGEDAPPRALSNVPEARRVHLDVREDIRRGEEPFARVMTAVKALADDHALVLRAPFEPIPLYDVLGKRGFAHWAERHAPDDWSVSFYREAAPFVPSGPPVLEPPTTARGRTVLDVRGLEPPQPMVRILEAVARLAPGAELEVRHDRRPIFLYPQLDERGCLHETDEPEPGLVRILIRRRGA